MLKDPVIAGAVATLSLFVTVVGLFLTWRANRFSKRCAEAQKLFEARAIELSLFGHKDVDLFVLSAPLKEGSVLTTEVTLAVKNVGTAAVHEARLIISANKELSYGASLNLKQFPQKHPHGEVQVSDGEQKRSFIHDIKSPFYPGLCIGIPIPITIRDSTRIKLGKDVETVDKQKLAVTGYMRFAWTIDVVLFFEEGLPITKEIQLFIVDSAFEDPASAVSDMTLKDVKKGSRRVFEPFLYGNILADSIRKSDNKHIRSAEIESGELKFGFFDSVGGHICEGHRLKLGTRHLFDKLQWLTSHGYRPQRVPINQERPT